MATLKNNELVFANGDIPLLNKGRATDCNNCKATGLYKGDNMSNAPSGVTGYGSLIVIQNPNQDYVRQFYMSTGETAIYQRISSGGTWGSWTAIIQ